MTTTTESTKKLKIERTFNAPRQLVWDVWTKPEHIANWYGPRGFSTRVETMDFKPGGEWRYVMIRPDGDEYPVVGTFEEIVEPERIVTKDDFPESPDGMKILVTTVLFDDLGDQTKLTFSIDFPSEGDREKYEKGGAVWGWNSSFDKLEEVLQTLD